MLPLDLSDRYNAMYGLQKMAAALAFMCEKGESVNKALTTMRIANPDAKIPMPFIPGTALGPRLLGIITEYFDGRLTYKKIRRLLASIFDLDVSASAISNARRAVAASLNRQMDLIRKEFIRSLFVHIRT